jgi:dTDP-glucose 4,6-dehydratase
VRALPPIPTAELDAIVSATAPLWDDLRRGRLFVTGGTGFYGAWMLESFLRANARLGLEAGAVVLTRRPEAFRARLPHVAHDPAITLWPGDVRDFPFPDGPFTHVVHAATVAAAGAVDDDPLGLIDTIVQGTRRTLDLALARGATRFLLTSSGAVYGRTPPEVAHVPEDHPGAPDPMDPRSGYAQGKRLAEHLCAVHAHRFGLEATILRSFALAGPHLQLDAGYAFGDFVRDGLAGRPIRVGGDGTPVRSYLYATDLMIWLWTILFRGVPARPYNLGSEHGVSIAELAHRVAERCGVEVHVANAPTPGRVPGRYVPSTRRARTELGLEERVGLDEAIDRTLAWWRSAGV